MYCDFFLVFGMLFVVFFVVFFLLIVKEVGVWVVIVNCEFIEFDVYFDFVIYGEFGDMLSVVIFWFL